MAGDATPRRGHQPLRLLQFTDTHLSGDPGARLKGVATLDGLRRCVAHARRHHLPTDLVLLTGDLVQDDPLGYAHFSPLLAPLGAPVAALPGNHDLPAALAAAFPAAPLATAAATRHGDWLLLLLDSSVAGAVHGELPAATLAAADAALARHADAHALVVVHHQPVPMGSAWLDAIGLANGAALLALLARHGNVRGLLWGHVHQAWDGERDGMALMSTPSTCVQFRPGSADFALDDRPPGYRWLHLQPDGRIDTGVEWVRDTA